MDHTPNHGLIRANSGDSGLRGFGKRQEWDSMGGRPRTHRMLVGGKQGIQILGGDICKGGAKRGWCFGGE